MRNSGPETKNIEECYVDYMTIQYQIQHLQGEILTVMEASMQDGKQQNAVRMLTNEKISKLLTRFSDLAEPVENLNK